MDGPFRCLRCGGLATIDAPGLLTLGIKQRPIDATAPACVCGGRRWVRAGTMSDYQLYARRADVCRIGDHIDPRARPYQLVPRVPPTGDGIQMLGFEVQICPDHVEHVRTHGLHGCFPAADGEAPAR